ncbi:MAG TPA: SIS domain-containing protein, partial [Baekduia sp.]|nr:SIS domain-containing protein [Baekduia sp.]
MSAGAQMTAEMAEQPRVLRALAARRGELAAEVRAALRPIAAPAGIVLVARGSSDNAAVFGRYVLELATRRPVALAAPSLVTRYGVQDRLDGWLAVGVSQSGRTPEIVSVLESFGAAGAVTVAVTNDRDSPLAHAAGATIDTAAGAEQAVPATKTVTSQFAAFAILAEALGEGLPWDDATWAALPDAVGSLLEDDAPARAAAEVIGDAQGLVAIARGLLLGAA